MLAYWIWLAGRAYVGDHLKAELLTRFSDPQQIYQADREAFTGIEGMTERAAKSLMNKDMSAAEAILSDCAQKGIRILTFADPAYPEPLRNIYDPPVVLYYKGTLPDWEAMPAIAVVGTRHPSGYGVQTAYRLGYETAACGGLVVSGLAEGIDGSAMWGALAAGKPCVGVLGCGVDIVFPASNRLLFRETEMNGCILSELAPGVPGNRWTFPRRNRIISGLCRGTVVVEAPEKSGSLITARLSSEQGRDVFVIPGNVDMPGFVGSNRLLRSGAIAVSTGWDILSEYEGRFGTSVSCADTTGIPPLDAFVRSRTEHVEARLQVAEETVSPGNPPAARNESFKKSIDNGASAPYIDLNSTLTGLSSEESAVVRAIGGSERLVDDVMAETGLDAGKVLAILTMLELKGKITRLPGKRVSLTGR